jgi:rhodanese-related sulfurtransferase
MGESGQGLSVKEAREGIASQEGERTRVIDIRSVEEFGEGHIAGAINVDDGDAESVRAAIEEAEPGADSWLVVCGDGERSREVASDLGDGEVEVAYLEGGIDAWTGEKLPVQPPPAESEFEGPKKKTLY